MFHYTHFNEENYSLLMMSIELLKLLRKIIFKSSLIWQNQVVY